MSIHPLKPMHVALYQALTGNAPLMALVSDVYDHVPQSAAFPYLVIEDSTAERIGMLGALSYRCETHLLLFSRQAGRKEIMEIIGALNVLLHHGSLSVTGFEVAALELLEVDTAHMADGITTRAIVKLRCHLTEAA